MKSREQHKTQPFRRLTSLSSRYLAATLVITLVLLLYVVLLQQYITKVRVEHSDRMGEHHQASHQTRLLRETILSIENKTQVFLWAPTQEQRILVHSAIEEAMLQQQQLAALPWPHLNGLDANLALLAQELSSLHERLNTLMDVRSSMTQPSRAIHGQVAPIFASLWKKLQHIDQSLEKSSQQDTAHLLAASRNIISTLWLLAIFAFVLILLGFWFFHHRIIQPIAQVTKALRDQAHGKHATVMPAAATAETQHLVEAFSEMHRLVQERQQALEHQATHDALTGLPNRLLLQDRLEHGIAQLRRSGYGALALLVMDLDGFKEINDTLGHAIGDGVLQQLTERLLREVRAGDTVARLGGDEFAVLLEQVDDASALLLSQRIFGLLEHPFEVAGQSLFVTGSIGIALYPKHAQNPQELSRRADVAMYVAKRNRSGIAFYDQSQDHHTLQRLAQASDLRNAINSEQLSLQFQPQIDLSTGVFSGVEALLRWQHPQLGFISPEDFIPIAEQTGLIRHLTYWVLDQALAHCAAWRNKGLPLGTISVNLSAYNLQDGDLSQEVRRLLKKWGIEPYRLVLELTESSMMANPGRAQATLEKLNDIGVQLAIDDFGTGFSSLSYLKQLPVDKLKIDKSFVIHMNEDENDAMIVHSTIELAHNLGLDVVAEGVENAETLSLLQQLKCDLAQGYYISRPLTADVMEEWLQQSPYCINFKPVPGPYPVPEPDSPSTH